MTQALSANQLKQLQDGLEVLAPKGVAGAPVAFNPGQIQTEFCDIWPKAEPILKIVAQYIVFVPGVGATAGTIINGLITGGNAMAGIACKKP